MRAKKMIRVLQQVVKPMTCPSYTMALIALGTNLSGQAQVQGQSLTPAWNVGPGQYFYLLDDNAHRGMGVSPTTGNIWLVSRTSGAFVYGLNGADGSEVLDSFGSPLVLSNLDETGASIISGGIFPLNMAGVGSDGAIYAGNLTLDGTTTAYKLYRWDSETFDSAPTLIYEGDPGVGVAQRWGDTLAVRGSGADTQILLGSRSGKMFSILATENGDDFTAYPFEVSSADAGSFGLGVAFGGGNTIWTKSINLPLHHISFDLMTGEAVVENSFVSPAIPNSVTAIGVDVEKQLLAGVALGTPAQVYLYDISDLSSGLIAMADIEFPVANANANGTGAVGFHENRLFALLTNNGVAAWDIELPTEILAPELLTQPTPQIVLEGGQVNFQVAVTGTPPFTFQWYKDLEPIEGADSPSFQIAEAALTDSGFYSVEISNAAGSVTSLEAELTVQALIDASVLNLAWSEVPGETELDFIATDNAQRGMAYNPTNGRVLLVSRTGGARIHVFDGATGEYLHQMDTDSSFIVGGTFTLSMVGVADDGAVYGSNLTLDGTGTPFTLYRWDSDDPAALPQLAFEADPGFGNPQRWGDTLAVRGSGIDTQILVASRQGTVAALFTTSDGVTFFPTLLTIDGISGGDIGLGLAFGDGNTFWGNAAGKNLRHISFDLASGTGTVVNDIGPEFVPSAMSAIGVDVENKYLAGILVESPDNIRLFDISDPSAPVLLDQEALPTDEPNLNVTGSVQVAGDRMFVLNTNNGLLAYDIQFLPDAPQLKIEIANANELQIQIAGSASATYQIQSSAAVSGDDWVNVEEVTLDAQGQAVLTVTVEAGSRFFRALANP